MSNGTGRAPDAAGDFKRYPFPRLIFFLFKKKLLGELALEHPGQWTGRIYFRDGLPVRADFPSSHDVLGRVLLERGMIDEDAFNRSLQALADGKGLQGRILVEMGAIDEKQLSEGLRLQLHRKLMRLFPLTDVRFALYNGEHSFGLKDEEATVRADPFWVVYNGVRHFYSRERMAPELAKLKQRVVQLNPDFEGVRHRYGFGDEEQTLLTYLSRSALSLGDVLRVSNLSPVETEMLVYALWVTEMLVVSRASAARRPSGEVSQPQVSASSPAEVTAAPLAVEPDEEEVAPVFDPEEETPRPQIPTEEHVAVEEPASAFVANAAAAGKHRKLIKETLEQTEGKTHYEVLGVTKTATNQQIRDAYFKLAKTFHPDRCNALGVKDVAEQAEEIFRRISEANAVLIDAERRKEYDEQLAGKGSKREVMNALEAEFVFQKGLFYLRKKAFKDAQKHFDEAYRLNPKEGEHLAHKAWAMYLDPKLNPVKTYSKVLEMLEEALQISPRSAQALFFLGEIYAAKGNDRKAVEYFDRTLEINPDHLEAERHLRLIRIREDRRRAAEEKSKGFFGRLLSNKDKDKNGKKGKKKPKPKKWY